MDWYISYSFLLQIKYYIHESCCLWIKLLYLFPLQGCHAKGRIYFRLDRFENTKGLDNKKSTCDTWPLNKACDTVIEGCLSFVTEQPRSLQNCELISFQTKEYGNKNTFVIGKKDLANGQSNPIFVDMNEDFKVCL